MQGPRIVTLSGLSGTEPVGPHTSVYPASGLQSIFVRLRATPTARSWLQLLL